MPFDQDAYDRIFCYAKSQVNQALGRNPQFTSKLNKTIRQENTE